MLKIFVLLFAIALAIYTEKVLIPLCKNSGMKFSTRWGYINSILIALIAFSQIFQYIHIAYVLLSIFAFWTVADNQFKLAEMEAEKYQRLQELKRQKEIDAKIAWEKERQRLLLSKDCPIGLYCEQMGEDGDSCVNRKSCNGLVDLNKKYFLSRS